MDAYPCPACGGVAVPSTGCQRCGRPHDPQAAELAVLNRRIAVLVGDDPDTIAEVGRLRAQADVLRADLRRRLTLEATGSTAPAQRAGGEAVRSAAQPPPRSTEVPVRSAAPAEGPPPTTAGAGQAFRSADDDPTPPHGIGVPQQRIGEQRAAEVSEGSDRNIMLVLGGVLLGIPAVVATVLSFRAAQTGGRAAILAVATLVALVMPLLLARRTLTATAETLAAFGLLAVLLDGYLAYSANLVGLGAGPLRLYSSVLCGLVAAIAAGYRLLSHLRAPQFATLLAVQPVLPLLASHLGAGRDGFALVFAVVAALNLGSVELLGRDPGRALRAVLTRVHLPGLAPGPGGQPWPLRLRELAWTMFGTTLAASAALAAIGLVAARTAPEALRSGLLLLLAAGLGLVAGLLARRPPLGHVGGGVAVFLLLVAAGRVATLAQPGYALMLTAALAVAIALLAGVLPSRARAGPRWGSLAGAAPVAAVVLTSAAQTVVAAVRASVTPSVWAAEVAEFAQRVRFTGAEAAWLGLRAGEGWVDGAQVPVAAALLALLVAAAVPAGWRVDAFVAGLAVLALTLPGTGALAWWAMPVLAWAVSTVAIGTALPARRGASAAVRAGVAGLLAVVAIATGLARPGLTAVVCALVALQAVGTVLVTGLARNEDWPYARRVADAAVGAGACTLPVAVGTATHLAGGSGALLVPVTLLATALGVAAAMLAQVAAATRASRESGSAATRAGRESGSAATRAGSESGTASLASRALGYAGRRPAEAGPAGSAAGAIGAAAGGLLLALRVEGTPPVDLAVAGLLALAAVFAVATRNMRPAAAESGSSTRLSGMDGPALAAAFATAGLVLALARLGAVLMPGIGLVMTTAMVLVTALGVAVLPRRWRTGPRLGSLVVGAGAVTFAAGIALVEAGRTVAAVTPYWHADLAGWSQRVGAFAPYGAAVPVSLVLAALAAALLLRAPANLDVFFVLVCLATLALPAVTGGPWWRAPVGAGLLAAAAGTAAAFTRAQDPPGTHRRRLALAAVLAGYALAVGATSPAATATVAAALSVAGLLVAGIAALRPSVAPSVAGLALAASLALAPGAAACAAIAAGTGRTGTQGVALATCLFGVLVVAGLRQARVAPAPFGSDRGPGDGYPGLGVGLAALGVAIAIAIPNPLGAPVWAAACALFATVAAGHSRQPPIDTDDEPATTRVVTATIAVTAIPTALFAAAMSTPAWVAALVGPFQTLDNVWGGYPPPASMAQPRGAVTALGTLLLLAPTSGGIALVLGGRRYLLAALLPPLAAAAVVLPGAFGASQAAVPWVSLGVALATGLGAALSRPVEQAAATWLRACAGVVCALTGAAGLAGSLATRATTLAALGLLALGSLVAALAGRDPLARAVAWTVFALGGLALPPTALLDAGMPLRPAGFGMLAVCAVLVGLAWLLSRWEDRHGDATVLEFGAVLGALASLALALGSTRHTSAVLTVGGLLLGAAALPRDRGQRARAWLIRLGLTAELAACWLLLRSVDVSVPEAYTLPFAVAALLAGAVEQRHRHGLSSWVAYGPGLAGAFLPSLTLVLVDPEPAVGRWTSVFLTAVAIVIVGSLRGWRAPVVVGATIAVIVAVVQMIRLLVQGQVGWALLVGLAGVILIVFGAFAERSLRRAR